MKEKSRLLLTGCLILCLCAAFGSMSGASDTKVSEQKTIYVFAAASMTETLSEIGKLYEEEREDIKVIFNFDSSGTLKTQIQEGADCDLFISAGQKQMNQLDGKDETGTNTEKLDLILSDTRRNILENKVVLVVPDGNPKEIQSFADFSEKMEQGDLFLAMGNSDVPVGQYTEKILAFYGLDEEKLADGGAITYGSNVKEVTTQVKEGSVDCGIVYSTDACSAGLTVIEEATKEMCGQVIYPAAVCKEAKQPEEAEKFLEFLSEDACTAIFEKVGFSPITEK